MKEPLSRGGNVSSGIGGGAQVLPTGSGGAESVDGESAMAATTATATATTAAACGGVCSGGGGGGGGGGGSSVPPLSSCNGPTKLRPPSRPPSRDAGRVSSRRTSRDALPLSSGEAALPANIYWSEWYEASFSTDSAPPLQPHPIALADEGAGSHTLKLLCCGLNGCGAAISCVRLELQNGAEVC